jgi:hypothetical protein
MRSAIDGCRCLPVAGTGKAVKNLASTPTRRNQDHAGHDSDLISQRPPWRRKRMVRRPDRFRQPTVEGGGVQERPGLQTPSTGRGRLDTLQLEARQRTGRKACQMQAAAAVRRKTQSREVQRRDWQNELTTADTARHRRRRRRRRPSEEPTTPQLPIPAHDERQPAAWPSRRAMRRPTSAA